MDPLEQAAKAIYEELTAAGHGPRPWAAHSPNTVAWEDLPPRLRAPYVRAAEVARARDGQLVLEPRPGGVAL